MSKKFRDKLLKSKILSLFHQNLTSLHLSLGSGYSNKKFECDYGMKLLKAMGWKE